MEGDMTSATYVYHMKCLIECYVRPTMCHEL